MFTRPDSKLPLRLLLSAYACHPLQGSEPGVGWMFLAAALDTCAEVHLLTRENNVDAVQAALTPEQRSRCRIIGFDLSQRARAWKKRLAGSTEPYYIGWQRKARPLVRTLHVRHRYGVAHHVTFAGDWTNVAVRGIDGLPFVWGPIGGVTKTPPSLFRYLGIKGALNDLGRSTVGGLGRALVGNKSAHSASLVIAANRDVSARYSMVARQLVVEPNAAVPDELLVRQWAQERQGPVVGVGRLIPWKGWSLALDAIARLPDDKSIYLTMLGDGPDRPRLEARARHLGISHRVRFKGNVPRKEVLSTLSHSRALLHPSFHDSSPWAVAEALRLGCPVVCLDLGGPQELVERAGGTVVSFRGVDLVGRLANALSNPAPPHTSTAWSSIRLPRLLKEWYGGVTEMTIADV